MLPRNTHNQILIVGNGSIALSGTGERFINNHIGQLLLELTDQGYVPTYIAPYTNYDINSNLLNFELTEKGVDSVVLKVGSKAAILRSLLLTLHAVKKATHIYIFFPGTLGLLIVFFCRLMGKSYGLYVRGGKYSHNYLSRIALKAASFILTVSPSIAEELRTYCDNVFIIRPMIDIECSDKMVRKKIQTKPERWKLLFVGNLKVNKGIIELITAVKILNDKGFSCQLKVVGGGVLYDELLSNPEVGSHSLTSNIELTGVISDKKVLMREYENADIFILPTYHEGFPRVLYEAMIKSLPIITTMVGGIPGRMVDNENCLAIEARSSTAIVAAIEYLDGNLDLYNKIGYNGQNVVLEVLNNNKSHCELLSEGLKNYVH